MNLIEVNNISKSFGDLKVLNNINLVIKPNRIYGLLGRNGQGKSTLLKLLNDLLTIDEGEILFKGEKLGVNSKLNIAFLPERTYLDKDKTVKQVFKYFEEFYSNFNIEKAKKMLIDLKLDEQMKISKMSKGMQEKLQLILVMARDVDLYILDEPLGGVDPASREYILKTILSNFNENSSMIISTHIISDVETILDEIFIIEKGNIVLKGTCDDLREEHNASIDEIFRRLFR